MLDGTVLALADQRRAGEDNGQHGDVVDDRHHRAKALLFQVRVKAHSYRQLYRQHAVVPIAGNEAVYFAANNILDIAVAGKGLAHARGVDVDLHFRLAAGQHIALEVRRNIDGESVAPGIQAGVHLIGGNQLRFEKPGAVECVNDA